MRVLLALAVLPAIVLMIYVYRKDRVEKEPFDLLLKLALFGVLSCVPAVLLEKLLFSVLDIVSQYGTLEYTFFEAFVAVAAVEEGCKYFFMSKGSWNHPDFDCTFDGIVYAVFVSLGFAAIENVKYLFSYGAGVLLSRALLSVPGHMTFSVYMGVFYSKAKQAEYRGDYGSMQRYQALSLLSSIVLHGFYDFCLMSGIDSLYYIFLLFVVLLDIVTIAVINRASVNDTEMAPTRFDL